MGDHETDAAGDREWFWNIIDAVDHGGFKTGLKCPECGGLVHTVVELGWVGPKDEFGVACAVCGERVARLSVEKLHPDAKVPSERLGESDA